MTPDHIKDTISTLPSLPDDTLIHYFKCCSSKQSAAEKKLYKPLIEAIEKERRKRGTSSTISSKIVQPSTRKSIGDDYEGTENAY